MPGRAFLFAVILLVATSTAAPAREQEQGQQQGQQQQKSSTQEGNGRQVLEEIVARVNNEIITLTELEHSEQLLHQELSQKTGGAELDRLYNDEKKNVLRDLIDQSLLVQRGRDHGVSVEADVIKRLDQIRQNMGLGSMEELERAMAAQGVSLEDYKENIREQLITQIVIQREVASNIFVESEKVRNYYLTHRDEFMQPERVQLREILVSTEGYKASELPAREERVREVLAKIRKGEKFEDLAKEYSDAPTAKDGGNMGYFDPSKLAPTIRDAVMGLNEMGVADPIQTREGWLILQLVDHRTGGLAPLEEVEPQISNKLYMDEVQPALRDFLGDLRQEAYIYVRPGYEDSGAVAEVQHPQRRVGSRRSSRRRRTED